MVDTRVLTRVGGLRPAGVVLYWHFINELWTSAIRTSKILSNLLCFRKTETQYLQIFHTIAFFLNPWEVFLTKTRIIVIIHS